MQYTVPNFTDQEIIALEKIIDAALKGAGVTILNEVNIIAAKMQKMEPVNTAPAEEHKN